MVDVHVSVAPYGDGGYVSATYTVAAPGGAFDAADAGVYSVSVPAGAVSDSSGRPFPAASTTFSVTPQNIDTLPPAAQLAAGAFVLPGALPDVVVDYLDDSGIDFTTIDATDLTVTGPAGPLTVTAVNASLSSNGAHVTYAIAPPGGTWDAADNGTYTLSVAAGAVEDTSGNAVAAVSLQKEVVIGPPPPGPDLVAEMVPDPGQRGHVRLGDAGVARVKVTNQGTEAVNGPVAIRLAARGNTAQQVGNAIVPVVKELVVTPARPLRLKPGQSRVVTIRFHYPKEASSYDLEATVDPDDRVDESLELNNSSPPFYNVAVESARAEAKPGGAGAPRGGFIPIGRRMTVPVTLLNDGNTTYRGPVNIDLFATNGSAGGGSYVRLGSGTILKRVSIRPDGTKVVLVSVLIDPALPPGEYTFRVNVNVPPASATGPTDFNNSVTGGQVYTAK